MFDLLQSVGVIMPIQDWLSLVAILASGWGVVHTIRRNHEFSLAQRDENFKQQIKLDLYREIRTALSEVISNTSVADTTVRMLPSTIARYWKFRAELGLTNPIRERSEQLCQERSNADDSLMALASLLDSYSAAVPSFKIFAQALYDQMEKIRESNSKWFSEILKWIPIELVRTLPDGRQYVETNPRTQPGPEDQKQLEQLTSEHLDRCSDMGGYVYDIGVEAENLLIGELFKTKRPSRQPLDSSIPVLDSKPETLKRYEQFFNEKEERKMKEIFSEYDLERMRLAKKVGNV